MGQAKLSRDDNDWLNYKNTKSIVNKEISQNKTKFINNKLNNSNDRWSTIKNINNNNPPSTPRSISHNDKIINNPQTIADIANHYYIDTIAKLRNNIPKIPITPIEILKNIYPRNPNEFVIPLPKVKDIRNIILKSKSTHSHTLHTTHYTLHTTHYTLHPHTQTQT